jgi:monoamine oxidase
MNVRTPFLAHLVNILRSTGEIKSSEEKAARKFARREFLQTLGLAGAGAMTSCAGMGGGVPATSTTQGTVAIVGGGVAGLTAAYRLRQRGINVHLYEAAARFGGRMWTKQNFNEEGMFCELGGELVDTNHTSLIALAKELGIGIQPLKKGTPKGSDYYFIDGVIRTDAELIPAFAPLAKRIAADAEGLINSKDEYTDKALALDMIPLDRYLREAGKTTGTAEWVIQTLDVAYVTEYGVETSRQSALNFIDMISPDTSEGMEMYGNSDEAFRIAGGSSRLTDALVKKIQGRVELNQGHRLEKIEDNGKEITLSFAHGSETKRIVYHKVVMAIPFTVLRDIPGVKRLPLSPLKHQAIREMGWGANAKVMLGFREQFWKTLSPASHGGAFSDGLFQTWNTSAGQKGNQGILTCYIGGAAARHFSHGSAARYVDKVNEIFPMAKAAYNGHRAAMDWTHFALARGSFSATGVGQYCSMISNAATPELGGRLIFAGEHTSEDFPGYMNGGVESGLRAAGEI